MRAAVREEELEEIVGTLGQSFLGLTIHCARCHDHKFDPISQKDYYRFAAALGGVRFGERESLRRRREAARRSVKALARQITALKNQQGRRGTREPACVAAELPGWTHSSVSSGGRPTWSPRQPPVCHVLARGDHRQPGAIVAPAGSPPSPGRRPTSAWPPTPPRPRAQGPGPLDHRPAQPADRARDRQPALASPLRRRPGRHAQRLRLQRRPAHASRAARLAGLRLVEGGWSLKAIHRRSSLSAAYRQSSRASARPRPGSMPTIACSGAGTGGGWRARRPRRRAGRLGRAGPRHGRAELPRRHDQARARTPINEPTSRRSRAQPPHHLSHLGPRRAHPLLDALDCPDPSVSTPRRTRRPPRSRPSRC